MNAHGGRGAGLDSGDEHEVDPARRSSRFGRQESDWSQRRRVRLETWVDFSAVFAVAAGNSEHDGADAQQAAGG